MEGLAPAEWFCGGRPNLSFFRRRENDINMDHNYPFTAIVGQEKMKLALMLNLINPALGGVLIRGEKGTAKSTAVRGLTDLMEQVEVVEGCPFHCRPNSKNLCAACRE